MFRFDFLRLLGAMALSMVAVLGLTRSGSAGEQVPFKGDLKGTYTRTGTFPIFHLEPTVEGKATHLGRFICTLPHDVNLLNDPPGGTGTFEFTAANGDTVYGTFDTQATPTPVPGVIYAIEEMTITGGTGRFANATGCFRCERLVDTVDLTTIGSFEGSISRKNSKK